MARIARELEEVEEITLAVLHGSFLRDYPFRDIDVAVYVLYNVDPLDYKFSLESALEEKLGYAFDVQLLNYAPPSFARTALLGGRVIVERRPMLHEVLLLKSICDSNLNRLVALKM